MTVERLRLSAAALRRRLPDAGAGATHYRPPGSPASDGLDADLAEHVADSDTGFVLITTDEEQLLVVPPFPIESDATVARVDTAGLFDTVDRRCVYGVFLLRLGGAAVGVYRDDALVASKVGQRFVKNRHKKGGQSQHRFARTREKQVHELFKKACSIVEATFSPHEAELEHVFIGGDRRTLKAFRKECAYLDRFGDRLRQRILPVQGDPRHETLERIPREVRSSDVYVHSREAIDR